MKQTFLHVSDLHYRADWPEESDLVLNAFFEDVKQQLPHFPNTFVIFSGDLVQAGGEGDIYNKFQQKFAERLTTLGIRDDRRICIPGNHDVCRTVLKPLSTIQKGALSVIKDEESFNRNFAQLAKVFFEQTFASYASAESKFAQYTCCKNSVGGSGWELTNGVGVYCLNSALCSFGGLEDPTTGEKISDKERLHIDTRSLHQWLQQTPSSIRILVMHHPLEWLEDWARTEIENAISDHFRIVFSGHIHRGSSIYSTSGRWGTVHCVAPALFTRKRDALGYAFVTLDTELGNVEIVYRQKTPTHKFVAGTNLADNDTGKKIFASTNHPQIVVEASIPGASDQKKTAEILEFEFDEACTSYSSKRRVWVDRDMSTLSEAAPNKENALNITPLNLAQAPRHCVIRAPKQFGLTCLGAYIALQHHRHSANQRVLPVCITTEIPHHRQGVLHYIQNRCASLNTTIGFVEGLILDNWLNDQDANKILRIILAEYPSLKIIVLEGFEDFSDVANAMAIPNNREFEIFYLWSLKRARIRELVVGYLEQAESSLDEDLVAKKIIEDIDALNIHRTPLNCLLILKLVERSFDDSPVNRTEMIGKVLYFLFHEFDAIPRYATRPDLKDCEFALGYLCEWMIRGNKKTFTRNEFFDKVREYTATQMISLDIDVLFAFLATENILIRRGTEIAFRLSYWLYYFAAHRMHHSKEFAEFILSDARYAAFPEMLEFYTGIDRMRTDAVKRLTEDLKEMDANFIARTAIPSEFNPLGKFLWTPSPEAVEQLQQAVNDSIQESALPSSVKDAIADRGYDNVKPYNQEVTQFIARSTVQEMMQAMRGAARVLRNSDHVEPSAKKELLAAVMQCWIRICQILIVISPLLAANRRANFENVGFFLDDSFDAETGGNELWKSILNAIVDNVVSWHQLDIFSKKLGALFTDYIRAHNDSLGELLVLLLIIKQRPPDWENNVKSFILKSNKNSFYLHKVHSALWHEFRTSFASEKTRQQLRNLAAMSIAKHATGAKYPNVKLVEKVAKQLEKDIPPELPRTEE